MIIYIYNYIYTYYYIYTRYSYIVMRKIMIGQKDLGMALMTTSLANSVSKNGEIDESIWGAAQNPSQNLGLIWFNGSVLNDVLSLSHVFILNQIS